MKKIVFNVPDNTEVMHVVCVNPYVMRNGKIGTNLNAQFYDLQGGQSEFTPDIKLTDGVTEIGVAQNRKQEEADAGNT